MVRPFRSEVERYGEYSKSGEYVYDHPFLWGSKRTGPDLARIGGRYANKWHFDHMYRPDGVSANSIMPSYKWLFTQKIDKDLTGKKISALRSVGVPYEEGYEATANADLEKQAKEIVDNLRSTEVDLPEGAEDAEIIAVIAYLQRLGKDIKLEKTAATETPR
jgi:cytochrome c oxidase cbb3-type subunit I/II